MLRILSSIILTDRELRSCALIAVFFSMTLASLSSAHQPGRLTGGGSIACGEFGQVTHGFELHCKIEGVPVDEPNNLEINFDGGNNFHLTTLQTAVCTNQPGIEEFPPEAGFDTMIATGTGKFNNVEGATIEFTLTDNGEPGGGADRARFLIRDASGNIVLNCPSTFLFRGGDHQAHSVKP